jgi:hypothetical protein
MDLTQFSSTNFDVKTWINETLSQQLQQKEQNGEQEHHELYSDGENQSHVVTSLSDLQMYTSSTIAKLRVLMLYLNANLEQNCNNAVKNIPSALAEIDRMSANAVELISNVHKLVNKLTQFENSGKNVTESLQQLHDMRCKLDTILSTLREEKYLSKSLKNVRLLFEKRKLVTFERESNSEDKIEESDKETNLLLDEDDILVREMVNQLVQVKTSLSKLPQYDIMNSKQADCAKYEATLIDDFMGPRFCQLLINNEIAKAKREINWAKKLGFNCVRSIFLKYLNIKCEASAIGQLEWTKSETLEKFFSEVISMVQHESYIYRQVFGSLGSVEVESEQSTTESFNPICILAEYCLEKHYKIETGKKDGIMLIINQYNQAFEFARVLTSMLERDGAGPTDLFRVFSMIFKPFFNLQLIYTEKEREYLTSQIKELCKPLQGNINDEEGLHYELEAITPKLFSLCNEAIHRCIFFTGGVEIQAFIRVLNDAFVFFCRQVSQLFTDMTKFAQTNQHQDWAFIQNTLRLHSVVKDVLIQALNEFEKELRYKLQNLIGQLNEPVSKLESAVNHTVYSNSFNIENNYVLLISEKDPNKIKQIINFLRSVQEVHLPILSVATKSMNTTLEASKQLVHKVLFQKIEQALNGFNIPLAREEDAESEEEDSDDESTYINQQSFIASDYMATIQTYLVELVSRLTETLSSDDENRYWLDRIVKETIDTLQRALIKFLKELSSKKPSRHPSELRKNKQMVEPGILTPYAMKQIACDFNTLKNVLGMLYYTPSEEQSEFIDLIVRVFQLNAYKEQQQELSNITVKYNSVLFNLLKELLKRSFDYHYLR